MILSCPVCHQPLKRQENSWCCADGHSFDAARQGYVNLLTPQQRHSRHPGDTREMVAARRAFLDAGFYAPIARELTAQLAELAPGAQVMDAGCGEGYYLSALLQVRPDLDCCGVDISKDAVRYAAVREKHALWAVGTAAHLPVPDSSCDAVICMFAMTVPAEFHRVLKPNGIFLQVQAGRGHLMALKERIYPQILDKGAQPPLEAGFALEAERVLHFPIALETPEQVQQLLTMTPHFWRISREGAVRAAETKTLHDEAEILFRRYRKI
jgi:23S rRNA (guanine745-N1)-methyltransferase